MKLFNYLAYKKLYRLKAVVIAFALSVSSFSSTGVLAKDAVYDQEFFSKNEILFYNPTDTCAASGGTVSKLSGDDNRQKIWNYLTARGLSPEQAAGVLGNIKTESGQTYSPTINEFSQDFPEGGYGIVQWTGGRRDTLVAHLTAALPDLMDKYYKAEYSSVGSYTGESDKFVPKSKTTGELMPEEDNDKLLLSQLEFLVSESLSRNLHTPAIGKGYGTAEDKEWNVLLKQTTVEDASNVWVYSFEIPADIDTTAVARAKNGQEIFDLYASGESGGGCGGGSADKKQLATEILATNNLYYDGFMGPEERALIPDIASGKNDGNTWPCGMNIRILQTLAAITKENRIRANSLNRACSKDVPDGSSTVSRHYAGNGSAIDFGPINGLSSYSTQGANLIMKYIGPFLVDGSGAGQSQGSCVPSLETPTGVAVRRFEDFCTHLHVDLPPNSDPALQCKVPVSYGGCDNPV